VKRINHALFAAAAISVVLALSACGDNKQVSEVKAMPFANSNMTVENALDTRKICDAVKWSVAQDDRNQTVVQYDCEWKGVEDSAFLDGESPKATSAADVWQWTFGADSQPTLTGMSIVVRHEDGSVHEIMSGGLAGQVMAGLITANRVEDYDHAFSIIASRRIPLKYQEPSSPIPDSTYGNKLAQFYHGLSSGDAAAFAYRRKNVNVGSIGTDSQGYPQLGGEVANPADLYPVDPADVQLEFPLFNGNAQHPSAPLNYQPRDLDKNKLYCMGDYCFDSNNSLVGKTPPEVLAEEKNYVTDGYGHVTPVAQMQQSMQAPSQQAMQQAVQQDTATQASAANPLPTGSSDSDWPAMTPCLQKLEDAARKQADAQGLDNSISIDTAKEMANTCKTLGQ
jgi:hypothetical protein